MPGIIPKKNPTNIAGIKTRLVYDLK